MTTFTLSEEPVSEQGIIQHWHPMWGT